VPAVTGGNGEPDHDEVLRAGGPAKGGGAVARAADGAVVFVDGALPGELVRVSVTEARRDYRRATVVEVLEPSPDRVEPGCAAVAAGCGGCDLLHLAPAAQPAWKVAVVEDALRRVGRFTELPSIGVVPLPVERYRTTVRCVVEAGRAAYRRRNSHDAVVPDDCGVLHPLLEEMLVDGRFGGAAEVTLRAGARTGERLALVTPTAEGVVLPPDVRIVGADELAAGRRAWFHEEIAGHRFRISAMSFFQVRPDGAEALVGLARDALAARPGPLADLYAGVGLFAATVAEGRRVFAVERSRSSLADARVNLAGLDARIVASDVARWRSSPCGVVIADPAREGLRAGGTRVVAATGAGRVVLISCDPAALARDLRLLHGHGYTAERIDLVDLFGGTSHVEAVTVLDRR
jgi:23S rRNA (uracil1939-C5)-methyltransferase